MPRDPYYCTNCGGTRLFEGASCKCDRPTSLTSHTPVAAAKPAPARVIEPVRAPTFTAVIYIAGDLDAARSACRSFCQTGLCVTVEPLEFIYTGGAEAGVRVGLINYPRFPSTPSAVTAKAVELADHLRLMLCQDSYSIVTSTETIWDSKR